LLEDGEDDEHQNETPQTFEANYLQGIKIVITKELFLNDIEAT